MLGKILSTLVEVLAADAVISQWAQIQPSQFSFVFSLQPNLTKHTIFLKKNRVHKIN